MFQMPERAEPLDGLVFALHNVCLPNGWLRTGLGDRTLGDKPTQIVAE